MAKHYMEQCKSCGIVLGQPDIMCPADRCFGDYIICRCPSKDKHTEWVTCNKCNKECTKFKDEYEKSKENMKEQE